MTANMLSHGLLYGDERAEGLEICRPVELGTRASSQESDGSFLSKEMRGI